MSINQYKIEKQIGKGNFATVYKAIDRHSRKVAIKVISKALSKQECQLAQKETKILEAISEGNDNIIRLYKHFKKDQIWYMVFEYCGQGDLDKLLKKKSKFDETLVQLITLKLVGALEFLDSKNIAHRDIKLANILFDDNFQIKLADLGFAKESSQQELFKTYAGTPLTMAPEIFEGKKYTNKCDVWSLGIIVYQMIYGRVAFLPKSGGGLEELIQIIKTQPVKFPSEVEVSQQCKKFIEKCLKKKPNERISPKQMLKDPWIINAKNSQINLKYLLEQNIRQSKLYRIEVEYKERFMDQERIIKNLNEQLKKTFNRFVTEFQAHVELLKTYFGEAQKLNIYGPDFLTLLRAIIAKRTDNLEKSKLQIIINGKRFCFKFQEFHPNSAALINNIYKSIKAEDKDVEDPQRQFLMQAIQMFVKMAKQKNPREAVIYTNLKKGLKLLNLDFRQFEIQFKLSPQTDNEIIQVIQSRINSLSNQRVLKLLYENPEKNHIPLLDVFESNIRLSQEGQPNKYQAHAIAFHKCLERTLSLFDA